MLRMSTTFILTWMACTLYAGDLLTTSTDGLVEYSDGRVLSRHNIIFDNAIFTYSRHRAGTSHVDTLGFREGTFGHFHQISPTYFWQQGEHPQPTGFWACRNSDQSVTAQISIPVYSQMAGGKPSRFTYRLRTLKEYPEWIFLRVTFTGNTTGMVFNFDAGWPEFTPANPQGAGRHLVLEGKDYLLNGPDPLPKTLQSDNFILYATNSTRLEREMSVLVFDPAVTRRHTLYSQPNGVRAFKFSCYPADPEKPMIFALGNFRVRNGKSAVLEFYQQNKTKGIRDVLEKMDWDNVQIDSKAEVQLNHSVQRHLSTYDPVEAHEDLDSLEESLDSDTRHSNLFTQDIELTRNEGASETESKEQDIMPPSAVFDALISSLRKAKELKEYDTYFQTIKKLKILNRKLAEYRLRKLLSEN